MNVVYYAPPEFYSNESLEEIALALAMQGQGVLFCGEGRKTEGIIHDDIIYANKPLRIKVIEKKQEVLFPTYNALIYDARTININGAKVIPSEKEYRFEEDLNEMIPMSYDQPVAVFLDVYNPTHIRKRLKNSKIQTYCGNILFKDGVKPKIICDLVREICGN